MWTLHPASNNSETAMRLWGISLTLNALLAAGGSFCNFSNKLSVVWIGTWEVVLSDMLGSWVGDTLQSACFPRIDVDAVQSRYAVVLFGFGGLVQPGGSSSHIFIVLLINLNYREDRKSVV